LLYRSQKLIWPFFYATFLNIGASPFGVACRIFTLTLITDPKSYLGDFFYFTSAWELLVFLLWIELQSHLANAKRVLQKFF